VTRGLQALALTVLLCADPNPAPAAAGGDGAGAEAAIRAAAATWIRRYQAGDLEGLMALYTDSPTVALHGQPLLEGRQAVRAFFAPAMGRAEVDFTIAVEAIEVHGDVAHLMSKYWLEARPHDGGEPYRDAGRSLLIYRRAADGRWLIHVDIDQATPDVTWPPP